jgi:indolepyruvate ferredoxin oxidoreductase beta subunit
MMANTKLSKDPYNIIITGVGGQGNVMASRILANMLVQKGYYVTIGESFGASQRGGSVMSHLRVSEGSYWSPQIPRGMADVVIALEPTEGLRVLMDYGNPQVKILSNTRPVRPPVVIAGDMGYPSLEEIKKIALELASDVWFIDATDKAVKMGNPILGNIIMLGALSGVTALPLDKGDFKEVISKSMAGDKIDINLKAYDLGEQIVKQA